MQRVAINGYGNLGRGVEKALGLAPDLELAVVFTRRDPQSVKTLGAPVASVEDMPDYTDDMDVCINCGGSATDLMEQGVATSRWFHTVDSFDTHARIPEYFSRIDAAAQVAGHCAIISCGWDPGLFSMLRVLGDAVLPSGRTTTFWGRGVSQGHSDAIRRLDGVVDARQYTVPVPDTVAAVQAGHAGDLSARQMHTRECFVVAEPGADTARIEAEIKAMPNYFADYDTTVTFITAAEMAQHHSGMPHAGRVIRTGYTSPEVRQSLTFSLELDSNPEFTGSVLVAVARACARKAARGETGAFTMLDITLSDLSPRNPGELRREML
ncbi:diaminopimelate dehydrogenase [uncultured Mobiluncus sp.]|uniref:diaminopimelate dehydrogenase n=1 Tax=uncultured Mobiluncus sp. TaxID=293425 RepID=UPI002623CED1|nr:diaminopimelate dehydrogenase [uncultured Mobiluncus sp.]